MKFKTTKKQVTNFYSKIIKLSYCSAQFLLHYQEPNAYTAGNNGWTADIYFIDNIAICTGYRPFGNIQANYSIVNDYEKQAEKIVLDYNLEFEEKSKKTNDLLKKFINEVTK